MPYASAAPGPDEVVFTDDISATGTCAGGVPCGPITVILTIILEKSKGIRFGDSNVFETKGKVTAYWDVDMEGYWYDPAKEIEIKFGVSKQPPWVKTTIEPAKMKLPYRPWECPGCVQPESSNPGDLMFYWEGDIKVKVEKTAEYTMKEFKPFRKSDGTYRVTFYAQSDASMLGTPQTGQYAGLQEGYGPKDLKFIPEPSDKVSAKSSDADVVTPTPGFAALIGAAAAAAFFAYRRK